jgi:hypothetical protein
MYPDFFCIEQNLPQAGVYVFFALGAQRQGINEPLQFLVVDMRQIFIAKQGRYIIADI